MKIVVLMYHGLEDSRYPYVSKDNSERLYVISNEIFEEHLRCIQSNNVKTCLLTEITPETFSFENRIFITFDDGHVSNFLIALPILQKFSFNADFFITTSWIGSKEYMSRNQIRQLYLEGMGIGSHAHTHKFLTEMSDKEVYNELLISKNILEDITGSSITTLSLPGGRVNKRIMEIARSLGYDVLCTSRYGLWDCCNSRVIPRIPIKKNISTVIFNKILKKDTFFLKRKLWEKRIFNFGKTLIGDKCYVYIHNKISSLLK